MRLTKVVFGTLATFAIVGSIFASSTGILNPKVWHHRVWPTGDPIINIQVYEFRQPRLGKSLYIRHRLVFDGAKYRSVCLCPLLASTLIKGKDARGYLWTDLEGDDRRIDIGALDGEYQSKVLSDRDVIVVRKNNSEAYLYQDGLLSEVSLNGEKYSFTYKECRLASVQLIDPHVEVIARLEYDDDKNSAILQLEKRQFNLQWNEFGSLQKCVDIENRMEVFAAEYKDGLVIHYTSAEADVSLLWGQAAWKEFFVPSYIAQPVVLDDGVSVYEYAVDNFSLRANCRSKRDSTEVGWIYFFKSKKFQYLDYGAPKK